MHVFIETYGCSANQAETEIMKGILEKEGYNIADSLADADTIILNTCIVKEPTEKRVRDRIEKLGKLEKKLIIAGCMPEAEYKIARKIAPTASMISTHHISDVVEAVKKTSEGKIVEYLGKRKEEKTQFPRKRSNEIIHIQEISQGCLSSCSYCCVKLAKGNLISYPIKGIADEISRAVGEGCKEIWITSQDCGCYGIDIGTNIVELLKEIIQIPGKFRVRVGMMNPTHILSILDGLIECYKSEKIYKFIHLPIQTGSDKVLKSMNRNYVVNDFKKIVEEFRKNYPEITIWTDIIVGFPGEDEIDFEKTTNLMKEIKPDFINISKFGSRPGTKASEMKQISSKEIKERAKRLSRICREIELEKNQEHIGKRAEVLITEKGKEGMKGRAENYKQVILGEGKIGELVNAKITSASQTSLFAVPTPAGER